MKRGKYADTEIMRLRRLSGRIGGRCNLETDVLRIQGQFVQFSYWELFEEQVSMLLPDHFWVMPDELAEVRYLSENRPSVILTTESLAENMGLTYIDSQGRDLQEMVGVVRGAVRNSAPANVFYESGQLRAQALAGYWFEYKSFTLNEEAYNLQFLISDERTALVGTFNCRMQYYDEWKPHILKALEYTKFFSRREV